MDKLSKVVLTDYVWEAPDVEREILNGIADIVALKKSTPDEFIEEARDCDALLNTYAGPITREIMDQMPKCKIIARYGIGVDTIDLDAATDAGIIVTNNPTYCLEEVAEHTMAMLLACARKIAFYDRQVRGGEWSVVAGNPIHRLSGKTLGFIGFGNIARLVAKRASAFGMKILFFDPYVEGAEAEAADLNRLLQESDFLTIHCTLTKQTKGMISDDQIARMKDGAVIINVSRGPIVDSDALVRGLDSGRIAGCALDTTDPEPLPDTHALRGRDNVTITPHVAWYSEESFVELQKGAPSEVRRVLTGEWPSQVVNPQVRGRNRAGL